MYEERKDKLTWKNYLVYVILLIIILSIFLLIIVKCSGKKKVEKKTVELIFYSEQQLEDIEKNYNQELASNMANFKYNVIDYYKDKLGNEKVDMTLTLQNLYDKHISSQLIYNDTECDSTNSKVVVVKKGREYKLTFDLVCGTDNQVSMTTYLGKYSYCKDKSLCEKKVEKEEIKKEEKPTSPITPEKPVEPPIVAPPSEPPTSETPPEPETPVQPETPVINKYTYYEYTLKPNEGIGTYSNWSDWKKEPIEGSLYVEVETKEETETKTEDCTETKEETYISGYNTERYISGYTTKKYKVGTKKVQTGTKQQVVNGKMVTVPVYTEQPIYQTKEEPVYATKKVPIYSKRQVKVDNCTITTKYYRSRTFTYNKKINYIVYSTNENDEYLINKGYVKTSEKKEF